MEPKINPCLFKGNHLPSTSMTWRVQNVNFPGWNSLKQHVFCQLGSLQQGSSKSCNVGSLLSSHLKWPKPEPHRWRSLSCFKCSWITIPPKKKSQDISIFMIFFQYNITCTIYIIYILSILYVLYALSTWWDVRNPTNQVIKSSDAKFQSSKPPLKAGAWPHNRKTKMWSVKYLLVGGFNLSETYEWNWKPSPNKGRWIRHYP